MPRTNTILQSEFPYNISARCTNREWFKIPIDDVWTIICEELYMITVLYGIRIHSLVLMGNHFHMIVSTPYANISTAMKQFMERTSKRLGEKSKRINQIWGARYHKTILTSQASFMNAYKYNYFNPVKAGIVHQCEDYPYSSLHGLLGKQRLVVPIVEDIHLFSNPDSILQWLNKTPLKDQLKAVRAALRKPSFKYPRCPNLRKPLFGDNDII